MVKPITIKLDEKALEIIDSAAKKEFSSRSNFMVRSAVTAARKFNEESS